MITESREVTQNWPATDGLVKCTDCRRFTKTERSGRALMVCSVDRVKPALVGDLWRRCTYYTRRNYK